MLWLQLRTRQKNAMRATDSFRPRLTRLHIVDAYTLDMRQKHAWCALSVRQSPHISGRERNEYPACVPRVSHACSARSARVWRPSVVRIHASISAHIFEHAQKLRTHAAYNDEWLPLAQRARRTSDECPAKDDALAKMNEFLVRGPCVVMCERAFMVK